MTVDLAYQYLFTGALTVMAVLIGIILIRSIIGPRIIDRILCINMIGTLVICTIAILSQMLDESYLTDIAIIYAMLSFLTVLILASVYIRKLNLTDEDVKWLGESYDAISFESYHPLIPDLAEMFRNTEYRRKMTAEEFYLTVLKSGIFGEFKDNMVISDGKYWPI